MLKGEPERTEWGYTQLSGTAQLVVSNLCSAEISDLADCMLLRCECPWSGLYSLHCHFIGCRAAIRVILFYTQTGIPKNLLQSREVASGSVHQSAERIQ